MRIFGFLYFLNVILVFSFCTTALCDSFPGAIRENNIEKMLEMLRASEDPQRLVNTPEEGTGLSPIFIAIGGLEHFPETFSPFTLSEHIEDYRSVDAISVLLFYGADLDFTFHDQTPIEFARTRGLGMLANAMIEFWNTQEKLLFRFEEPELNGPMHPPFEGETPAMSASENATHAAPTISELLDLVKAAQPSLVGIPFSGDGSPFPWGGPSVHY